MAYNNYFPTGYQPIYQQPQFPQYTQYPAQTQQNAQLSQQYQPVQQQSQPQNSGAITWVQGEAAAKSYPVAPGSSVLLMDSESSCFYIRSTDASGMPLPLRVFDYTERIQQQNVHAPVATPPEQRAPQQQPQIDFGNYITRDEFEDRLAQIAKAKEANAPEPPVIKAPARKEK